MSFSQNIFDGASQESVAEFSGQKLIQKKTFSLSKDSTNSEKENLAANKAVDKNQDILALLQQTLAKLENIEKNQQILSNGQAVIVSNQEAIGTKLQEIEDKFTVKPEMMAQTKALMECKVSIKRVEASVCRITGENTDCKLNEVAAMLPLRSKEAVHEMEEKLKAEDFAQATVNYMYKIKGTSEDVGTVIRGLFTDDLLQTFNWEGRWEKHSLAKLSICNKFLRDVFQKQSALEFEKGVKKAVERSHNRFKQKKYLKKEK